MRKLLWVFALLGLASACTPRAATAVDGENATAVTPAKSYVGAWDVRIEDTPMGTVDAVLTVTQTTDGLAGTIAAGGQTFRLGATTATGEGLRTSFYYPDVQSNVEIELTGAPDADALTGRTMGEFRTTARRKE